MSSNDHPNSKRGSKDKYFHEGDEPMVTEVAIAIAGSVDVGKCFSKGTSVMKFDGSFINVEDISVGDLLMGDDSAPRKVLETHTGKGQLYKIRTDDGACYEVNGKHILTLSYSSIDSIVYRKRDRTYVVQYAELGDTVPIPSIKEFPSSNCHIYTARENAEKFLKDSLNKTIAAKHGYKFEISVEEFLKLSKQQQSMLKWYRIGVDYNRKAMNVDPYLLGVDLANVCNNKGTANNLTSIPDIYKYNSRDVRLQLLAGIIDTTGKLYKNKFSITVKKKDCQITNDIIFVIKSLGMFIDTTTFTFCGYGQQEIPTKIIKKSYKNNRELTTRIKIEETSVGEYFGFEVNSNHRFLLSDFSVVHNSTFIGVMRYGELDDGNGTARRAVAKHPHEKDSGKTSDISTRVIASDDGKRGITFVDLCGHEKYLKTTTRGINGYFPDYAFPIVAANRGVIKMTREHLGILFYLEIPSMILITRVDLVAGSDIYTNTIATITKICKANKKQIIQLNSDKEFFLSANELKEKEDEASKTLVKLIDTMAESPNIVPVITISCKTGYFLNTVRSFINNIKPRKLWDASKMNGTIFYIDQVFNAQGVGVVVSGIVKGKTIKQGDVLYIGPNGKDFATIRVKSIHNDNRQEVQQLSDHQRGCIAVSCLDKKINFDKSYISRGMIAVYPEAYTSKICYRFKAEIDILHHASTIKNGYSPFIHAGPICQTARLSICQESPSKSSLSTGDSAIVEFKFKFKPEFIETFDETGKYFFFREGTTRGRGKIISIIKIVDDADPRPDPLKNKKRNPRKSRRADKDNIIT